MGVSPGYLNQPKKNVASFVTLKGDSQSGLLYRTGDIVCRRVTDGQIDYIGRCDHQVKVRGFRVELEAVESTLLRTGYFADAVVLKVNAGFDEAAGSMLVAFAVPAPGCDSHTVLNAVDSLKAVLPEYMVPKIELISKMPVNNHGKMDRKHLEQLNQTRWAQQAVDNEEKEEQPDNVRQRLARLWANVLGLPIFPGDDNADFFLLGATSIQASFLIGQIHRFFDTEISLLTLYDNSTLVNLAAVIIDNQGRNCAAICNERDVWLEDSKIADSLVSLPGL